MKRRDVFTSVLVGGLAIPVFAGQKREGREADEHGGHGHHDDNGKSKNHAVSFGHWRPTQATPIDRFAPNDPNPRALNGHQMIPSPVRINVGDTVSFIISGFHNPQIFGPGTQPQDIDRSKLLVATPPPPFPPIIDDKKNRLYRGLDPRTIPTVQDRVEVVGFTAPGRYLVICGVLPHFFDAASGQFVMFGYVDVDNDD